jgi:hypothetical protein
MYRKEYIKYKNKYLILKEIFGGDDLPLVLSKFTISEDAKLLFIKYMTNFDIARNQEETTTKINLIIENIKEYFQIKLKDDDQQNIVELIQLNENVINKLIMKKWIKQNYFENYLKRVRIVKN